MIVNPTIDKTEEKEKRSKGEKKAFGGIIRVQIQSRLHPQLDLKNELFVWEFIYYGNLVNYSHTIKPI